MWQSLMLLWFLTLAFVKVIHSSVQDGLVSAPWGKIRGAPVTPSSGIPFTSFEGIPYAKPPLGSLRFSKPIPSTGSHATILEANAVRPSCLMENKTYESEDCLYLDMYVPHSRNTSTSSSLLNVMVFIHGGAFISYPGNLNPERLLEKNVIVALVHYRLGAMGFLSTGDDVLMGNYGLWDQRLAIKWVKDNVAAFGGDPDSITIFGESAGSVSVAYQILAPMSRGLFKRAILQSGTATSSWALSRDPARFARTLGVRLGCVSGSSSTGLARCLRNLNGVLLQEEMIAQWRSTPTFQHIGDFMFVPVVDHDFVIDEPLKLIQNTTHLETIGAFEKDIIVGVLNDEGTLSTNDPSMPNAPKFGDFFAKDIIPYMLHQRYGASSPRVEAIVDNFYRSGIPNTLLNKYLVSNAFADVQFIVPAFEFMEALSQTKSNLGRRYFYYFDYCPSFAPAICMAHTFDLVFVFPFFGLNFTTADQHMSDVFVSFLTTFAKTGTPVAANTQQWRQFSPKSHSYLRISTQSENKEKPFPKRLQLWTETIPLLFAKPIVPTPIIG